MNKISKMLLAGVMMVLVGSPPAFSQDEKMTPEMRAPHCAMVKAMFGKDKLSSGECDRLLWVALHAAKIQYRHGNAPLNPRLVEAAARHASDPAGER